VNAANAWHLSPEVLADYVGGTAVAPPADPVLAASVEAHLLRCATCRAAVAAGPAGSESERRWADLAAVVDAPRRASIGRIGLATRPLLTAWATALVLLIVVPLLPLAVLGVAVPTLLLALAPLVPSAAVALAYRVASDPAGEMSLATPLAGLRLVSRRVLLVGLAALPLGIGAALVLELPWSLALAWVLPGLALSALVLLAGTTRLDPWYAAATFGATWALAVGTPSALRRVSADVVAQHVAGSGIQLSALVVALAALALTFTRRERVSYRRIR
jgi:hypothetical protein